MIDALINRIAREISSFSSRSSRRLLIIFRANEPFCRALITAEKALLLLLFQSSNLTIHDEDIGRGARFCLFWLSFHLETKLFFFFSFGFGGFGFCHIIPWQKMLSSAAAPTPTASKSNVY